MSTQQNQQPKPVVKELDLKKAVVKNLVMGGTAGIIGAVSTYPLDMVKTRMQNQRALPGGQVMYKNSLDCFKKILAQEGARGLYRGLPAQLIGITPEKAIKLTINDTLRYTFTDKEKGTIKVWQEAVSGCAAGFSQVVVTNPYELVKVRLQTAKVVDGQSVSAIAVLKELGLRGLFTGAPATLLRDVPFSAIYFTLYGNLKVWARDEKGYLPAHKLFLCSVGAGAIAAAVVTPADVIKTRLQAKSTDGRKYNGISDAFSRVVKEEGPRALFKGTVPRVMIISPLFGITLMVYEVLQGYFL